jgi:hypothetical protein
MDVADPAAPEHLLGALDRPRHRVGRFDLGRLDVDDAEAEADLGLQALEHRELLGRAMRALEDDVVGVERVQVAHQLLPGAVLDALAAVVAEAQVHRRRRLHGVEDAIDGRRRPLPFLGMAGQVRLVELDDVGIEVRDLLGEDVGDRVRKLGRVGVVTVEQRLGEHVRAR